MENSKKTIKIEDAIKKYNGKINNNDAFFSLKGLCGDVMKFYLKISHEIISDIKFETTGCIATQICGAIVCVYADKRRIDEALFISPGLIAENLKKFFGGVIPEEHKHCPILAVNAFESTIALYMIKKGGNDGDDSKTNIPN